MIGHPHWCDSSRCTIAEAAQSYGMSRWHTSRSVNVGPTGNTVTVRLIQAAGQLPRLQVTTRWIGSGTAELDMANAQQLHEAIAMLVDLIAQDSDG